MKRALPLLLCGVIIAGCAGQDVKSIKITEQNKTTLLTDIKDTKSLTVEEVQLLQGYVMRKGLESAFSPAAFQAAMNGQKTDAPEVSFPIGKTVGEVIDEQRKWVADAGVRAAEAKKKAEEEKAQQAAYEAEQEKKRAALTSAVKVVVLSKSFTPRSFEEGRFDESFDFVLSFQNSTKKTVSGVKGSLLINDSFGDKIKKLLVKYDTEIKPKTNNEEPMSWHYNQFMNEDQKLRNTDLEKLQIDWQPEVIQFSDGSELRAEDSN